VDVVTAPVAALNNRRNNIRSIHAGGPDLELAVVMAEPDLLLEPLPFYVSNPTYLVREQWHGNVEHFSRKGGLDLNLGDFLINARRLRQETGRPVVVCCRIRLIRRCPRM
jgi:hypothetical protein